ncbi:hypothetical protein ACEODF_19525, partial [Klebsiella pneumoniae]
CQPDFAQKGMDFNSWLNLRSYLRMQIAKNTQQTFDIPFDYGFVCLGMRANRTGLDEIERWANANNVKIMNIGDSVMARRIIDGVREGRNVLDALEDMGALGSREAQRIPFLTY